MWSEPWLDNDMSDTVNTTTEDLFIEEMHNRFHPAFDSHFYEGSSADQTVEYFGRKGWDGYAETATGRIVFVSWTDDIRSMVTNTTGVIDNETRFSFDTLGIAMFAAATDALLTL